MNLKEFCESQALLRVAPIQKAAMSNLEFESFVARLVASFDNLVIERRANLCKSFPDTDNFIERCIKIWIDDPLTIEQVNALSESHVATVTNPDYVKKYVDQDLFKALEKAPSNLRQSVLRRALQTQFNAAHYLARSAALAKLLSDSDSDSELGVYNTPESTLAVLNIGWNLLRQFEFWYGRAVEFNERDRLQLAEGIGASLAKSKRGRNCADSTHKKSRAYAKDALKRWKDNQAQYPKGDPKRYASKDDLTKIIKAERDEARKNKNKAGENINEGKSSARETWAYGTIRKWLVEPKKTKPKI